MTHFGVVREPKTDLFCGGFRRPPFDGTGTVRSRRVTIAPLASSYRACIFVVGLAGGLVWIFNGWRVRSATQAAGSEPGHQETSLARTNELPYNRGLSEQKRRSPSGGIS